MGDSSSEAALAIIRKWEWEEHYPDEGPCPIWRSLSYAVNQLAFGGHPDAAGAMLSLLADGALEAMGDYEWRAYRNGHYRHKGRDSIPAIRWQALQKKLALPWSERSQRLTLGVLDGGSDTDYPIAEWAWWDDSFSTTEASDAALLFPPDYFEERFSARNIKVHCPSALDEDRASDPPVPVAVDINKGGAPARYDWERAVAAAVFRWADDGSWQPASKAEVKNRLADWFAEQGQHPSDSLLKERARWLFEEFQRRGGAADNLAA